MRFRVAIALCIFAFLLFAGGALLFHYAIGRDITHPKLWDLTEITGHLPDLDFTMSDDSGTPITGNAMHGYVTLLFFGYTNCPDECPATMTRLTGILKKLGKDADRTRVLFATVDPGRDTPQVLHDYLKNFDPTRMMGLTEDEEHMRSFAQRYRAVFRPRTKDDEEFIHSNAIYIFDAQGHARLIATPTDGDDNIIHDIHQLIQASDTQ